MNMYPSGGLPGATKGCSLDRSALLVSYNTLALCGRDRDGRAVSSACITTGHNNAPSPQISSNSATSTSSTPPRRLAKGQLLKQQLTRQQLASRLQVSDQDVEQGYRDYLSRVRSQVQVEGAHLVLLVPPGATPAQEASVRQRATELLVRIRGGEDFSAVTRSEGEGAGAGGDGYLGFITRGGGLPRALEDAFLELDEGEVGGPVRSPFGYHIVRAIKLHQVTAKSLEEMRPQLQQELRQGRFVKAFSEWVEELKQRAFIEEKL